MSITERINARIAELGLTQDEVAARANISQGMVYKLTSGRTLRTSRLVELAIALECDMEWLATGKQTASAVNEDGSVYQQVSKQEVQRLLRALPRKDQKDIALATMKALVEDEESAS